MKSNELSSNVHGSSQLSSSNLTLGGTQLGWIGDKSVPVTSAEGNSSPKSLS